MIRYRPMGSTCRLSDFGSGGTLDTKSIRCVDGEDPQIYKLLCLGLENSTLKVNPKAQIEVGAGTVGDFTTNYLAENRRRIPIIGKISINGNVQFLGIPDFVRGSGLPFIDKIQAPTVTTGWGHSDNYNKNWGVTPGGS